MKSGPVEYRAVRFEELTSESWKEWRGLQTNEPSWASPFLAPEFVEAVSLVRDDVFVGLILEGGRALGFFPFQKDSENTGWPVAKGLCDFQAVLAPRNLPWNGPDLLRVCGLRGFHFDHLLLGRTAFQTGGFRVYDSPWIALGQGFENFVSHCRKKGSRLIPKAGWSRRKLERDKGAVVFHEHDPDPEMLEHLMSLKSDQYRRTGARDRFAEGWIRSLLKRVHGLRTPLFSGALSTLHAGGDLVAAHLGMRTQSSWHYWFPAYDPAFASYSPGTQLLLEMAAHAAALGISRFDLGRGEDAYKRRLQCGVTHVGRGRVLAE